LPDSESFFWRHVRRNLRDDRLWTKVSYGASLDWQRAKRRIRRVPQTQLLSRFIVNTALHRFEESIAGRAYLIEVASVDPDRWRAYIVKAPGVPTALMPFYGHTPDEAADLLRQWLTRAHARAAASVRPT
jgi:hypothetical protein